MAKIIIKQIRSKINTTKNQKKVLESLGLRKINATVEHDDTPSILGMAAKVRHLVKVEQK